MQTFKELFFAHSNSTGRLELLAYCFPVLDADIPSWVPDWGSFGSRTVVPNETTFVAGMSKADFREARPGQLEASGIIHGAVTSTFEMLDTPMGGHPAIGPWLRKLIKGCITSATYPTGEDIYQAIARLLCRDKLRERFPENRHYFTIGQWQDTLDMLAARPDDDISDLEGWVRIRWREWEAQKYFRTEHGYLGCGSKDTAEGDSVCVLLGLYCPLVIRPSGDGKFRILGACDLHGLMDGEALLGGLPHHYTVQIHNVDGRLVPRYYNTNTGEASVEDPRLGPLNHHWQRVNIEPTSDDPVHLDFFQNTQTGEIINYDPRLTKTALEQRRVNLQTITFN